jgi:AAA domain-containing protein
MDIEEWSNSRLDAEIIQLDANRNGKAKGPRFKLVPFNSIELGTDRRYLVKGLVPYPGLTVIWGPPKCGKSFWAFDLSMHVALGRQYRGRRVHQGAVVYCCFEGQDGFKARAEAFRQKHLAEDSVEIPFHLMPVRADLPREYQDLIGDIRMQGIQPVAFVLDTLNRSLVGSENSDEDMGNYIKATDAIREAFDCSVLVVHHCGINDSRPRGHTSLTGAADARLAVTRDVAKNILVDVEFMKDGEEGETIVSALESVEVGHDQDGDLITSCVIVPSEAVTSERRGTKLSANQQTMLDVLVAAGRPLSSDEWTELAKQAGLGSSRRAWAWDLRHKLRNLGLVYEGVNGWSPNK